jgi:long-subunit acyl-CoA synthetase (AMP-forming)
VTFCGAKLMFYRLVNSNGRIIEKDEEKGEVQILCPTAMRGYLNNAAATAETFTPDDWIRTGDIGYVKNENWYIVDRTKDLIKVRGWQVSPAEIEAALLEHPDVIDAGVIGIPAEDGCGQSAAAFIKKREGSDLDLKRVRIFLTTILARYKNVEKVEFVDSIPRNPTGKILRRVLRETIVIGSVTQDMIVAQQYKAELQKLQASEELKTSMLIDARSPDITRQDSMSNSDSNVDNMKSSITQFETALVKKRKRACYAPFEYLLKRVRGN